MEDDTNNDEVSMGRDVGDVAKGGGGKGGDDKADPMVGDVSRL